VRRTGGHRRKAWIHNGKTKGQYRYRTSMPAFDLADLDAQRLKGGRGPHSVGVFREYGKEECSLFVLKMTNRVRRDPLDVDAW